MAKAAKFKKSSEVVEETVEQVEDRLEETSAVPADVPVPAGMEVLAQAIAQAMTGANKASKPVEKKTILTYDGITPWSPPKGEKRLKAKRKFHVHSLLVDPDFHSNEEIDLFNKVRPGTYLNGFVKVERRRDKGINISWQIKTPDQKMRLAATYGITSLAQLLQRCIAEAAQPKKIEEASEEDF